MVKVSSAFVITRSKLEQEGKQKRYVTSGIKNEQLQKKQLDYVLILPYYPKDKDTYYIIGDICIDFDLIRNQKNPVIISSLSVWRKILQIEKYQSRIHITLEKPKQQAITNFDFIIKKLLSLGDQRYMQFALAMENYKDKQKDFLRLKDEQGPSQTIDFSVQYWLSKIKAFNTLYNIQKSSIKFYAYHICAGSYEGQIVMEKGYSDDLIKVLGLDFESFKSITLRRGIIDFLSPETQLNIVLRRMLSSDDQKSSYSSQRQYKTTIITADSYTIDVITKPQLIILNESNIHNKGHLNDTMGFIEIEIEEQVIKELEQKRKTSRQLMLDSDYDLEYNMQAEVFIKNVVQIQKTKPIQKMDIQSNKGSSFNQQKQLQVAKYRNITELQSGDSNQLELSSKLQQLDTNHSTNACKISPESQCILPFIALA